MFQFPGLPSCNYGFITGCIDITLYRFSHSETHESLPACGSSWLFAAYRVLLRLLVPRHPPYALIRLTFSSVHISMYFGPFLSLHKYCDVFMQALKYLYLVFYTHFFSCKETVCSICSVGNCFTFYRKTLPLYIVQFSKNLLSLLLIEALSKLNS